jgi:hypothetical protein
MSLYSETIANIGVPAAVTKYAQLPHQLVKLSALCNLLTE